MTVDRPSIEERYASATHTAHLEVLPERCDVDYLIAIGWLKDSLGTRLHRLASEWDVAAGDYKLALASIKAIQDQADRLRRNSRATTGEDADELMRLAEGLMHQATREADTARILALNQLRTLRDAKAALFKWASGHADRVNFHAPDTVVKTLCSTAIEYWLEPNCGSCHGRGFSGGFGSPRWLCSACGATGKSQWRLSKTERHAAFVRSILAHMDVKASRVQQDMRRFLMGR